MATAAASRSRTLTTPIKSSDAKRIIHSSQQKSKKQPRGGRTPRHAHIVYLLLERYCRRRRDEERRVSRPPARPPADRGLHAETGVGGSHGEATQQGKKVPFFREPADSYIRHAVTCTDPSRTHEARRRKEYIYIYYTKKRAHPPRPLPAAGR